MSFVILLTRHKVAQNQGLWHYFSDNIFYKLVAFKMLKKQTGHKKRYLHIFGDFPIGTHEAVTICG